MKILGFTELLVCSNQLQRSRWHVLQALAKGSRKLSQELATPFGVAGTCDGLR